MVNTMDKLILVAAIFCCVISLAACQDASETNNSTSDLSEGLCFFLFQFKVPIRPVNVQIIVANPQNQIPNAENAKQGKKRKRRKNNNKTNC